MKNQKCAQQKPFQIRMRERHAPDNASASFFVVEILVCIQGLIDTHAHTHTHAYTNVFVYSSHIKFGGGTIPHPFSFCVGQWMCVCVCLCWCCICVLHRIKSNHHRGDNGWGGTRAARLARARARGPSYYAMYCLCNENVYVFA